jgi:spermidine/putrescine transport system permease protein
MSTTLAGGQSDDFASNSGASSRRTQFLARKREPALIGAQVLPITVFLAAFFIAPLAVFFVYSLWRTSGFTIEHSWGLQSYKDVVSDPVNRKLIIRTIEIALEASLCTILVAYTFAHIIRFQLRRWQEPLLFLVLIALFSGYLVRIYAWRTILGGTGILNTTLEQVGLIGQPLTFLLYSRFATILVLTNFLVPLAILPIYASLQNVDDSSVDAARDLGCGPLRTLRRVTLPLAWPGLFAAWALSFIIAAGDYVTPQLVGGVSGTMIGNIVVSDFGVSFNWTEGAALSFITLAVVLTIIGVVGKAGAWVLGR